MNANLNDWAFWLGVSANVLALVIIFAAAADIAKLTERLDKIERTRR